MISEFKATIPYAQVNIFRPEELDANLWNDDHVAQGFAWREGSVSFGVPDHDGPVRIEVDVIDAAPRLEKTSLRAVEVPFEVFGDGVLAASLIDDVEIPVPAGLYRLRFELRPGFERDGETYAYLAVISFIRDDAPGFAILRGDAEITAASVLTTTADPAR